MKVVHVTSNYFDKKGVLGGGERYALELARAVGNNVDAKLVAFGEERSSLKNENLKIEIYPFVSKIKRNLSQLFNVAFLKEIFDADIIHCHQIENNITNLCIIFAKLTGKRIVATDHGSYTSSLGLNKKFHFEKYIDNFLLNSMHCSKRYPAYGYKTNIIYGGVDPQKFLHLSNSDRERKAIFVGRLLPHKGVDYLVEGVYPQDTLHVIGMPYDQEFYSRLQALGKGKEVVFRGGISDIELIKEYSTSLVTVLPSVERDYSGKTYVNAELLGLTLLESMACGTPVICARTAAMPEVVEDGVDGFVVPPNDSASLGKRVNFLLSNPAEALRMGERGRKKVLERFTWPAVANKCIEIYTRLLKDKGKNNVV